MIMKIMTLLCVAVMLIANNFTTASALSETNSTESGGLVGDDIKLNTDSGIYKVIIGQPQQIIAYDSAGNPIDITDGKATYTIETFMGNDNGIQITEDGFITANAGGLFNVTIEIDGYGNTGFGVQAYAEPEEITFVDSISYLESYGDPQTPWGQIIFVQPANAAYAPVDFKIENESVAQVKTIAPKEYEDAEMLCLLPSLVGKNPGKTTLVASYGSVQDSLDIETIDYTEDNNIFQSPEESFDMLVDDTQQLSVYEYNDNYALWFPTRFWSIDSDNPSCVSVTEEGVVTALSSGEANITGDCMGSGSMDVPFPYTWHINVYDPTVGDEVITDIAIKNYGSPISLVQLQNTKSITFYPGETYVLTVERQTTGNIFEESYDEIANDLVENGLCYSYSIDHSVQRDGAYCKEVNRYTFTVKDADELPQYIYIPVSIANVDLTFIWADVAEKPTALFNTPDNYNEDKLGNAEANCNMLLSSIEDELMDAAKGVVVSGDVLNTSTYVTINPVLKYDVIEYDLDDDSNKTVTLDITPGYTLQFRNSTDPDEVPIHETEFQGLDLSSEADPLQMKIGVGTAFNEGDTVYVCHSKADGRKYYHSGTVVIDQDTGDRVVFIENPNGFSEFTISNREPKFVAAIGLNKYESLQDAVDAAGSEKTTISLLSDTAEYGVVKGDGVTVPSGSNITFDFNGLTYEVAGNVVSTSENEGVGFLLLEDSNVKFESAERLTFSAPEATIGIQNFGNLILDSMKLNENVLDDNEFCMLSCGNGTVNLEGSTNIYATDHQAMNLYDDAVVNIDVDETDNLANIYGDIIVSGGNLNITSGRFNGKIQTSDPYQAHDIAIKGGMFKYPVNQEYCSAGFIPFDTETGDWRYTVTNDPYAVDIFGYSLTLNGDIGVNYYLRIPEEIRDTVELHITYHNTSFDYTIADGEYLENAGVDDLYRFTVRVSAKEMRDQITLTVTEPIKLVSSEFNEDYTQNGDVYSVSAYFGPGKEYAKANQDRYPYLEKLINALDNYGRYAQKYFEYGDYANLETDTKAIRNIKANEIDYFRTLIEELPEGITYEGSNLILKTVTTYQMFFSIADGYDINDYSFTASNGDEYELVPVRESLYKIVFPNISAKDLNGFKDVYVQKNGTDGSGRVNAAPLTYVYDVLHDENTSDALKDLCRALYNYAFAAYQHFNPSSSGDQPIG